MADRKFHISLNVANLQEAVGFFGRFFRMHPTKMFADYAKFEVEDPPLVLSLEPKNGANLPSLNHVGIRVKDHAELQEFNTSIAALGLSAHFMSEVECCYSQQTKIALQDPDNLLWEVYVLDKDLDEPKEHKTNHNQATAPTDPAPTSCDHLLGSPLDLPFPQADASVDEVNLRGTFNAAKDFERRLGILSEANRILKPGGTISLHLLVSDKPVAGTLPRLPGPAALVDFTPVSTDLLASIENAGFGVLQIKRHSHAPVFQFDGCKMRELLLTAVKLPEQSDDKTNYSVVYKGPFAAISDDFGQAYKRGIANQISAKNFELLRQSQLADSFVFLSESASPSC